MLQAILILRGIALSLNKISLCLLLHFIFKVDYAFGLYIRIMIGVTVAWLILTIVSTAINCQPSASVWNPSIDTGSCAKQRSALIGAGALDFVIDLVILGSVIHMLYQLHIPRSKRDALVGTFGQVLLYVVIDL